ncbi:MAG: heavy metal translocating P-type ATPase, partial [Clostridia bacterium]|nr:heavy metal translocating P-type ATPase [Clostridia bacterium]
TATESFITKFAMRYTPTVVILALVVAFAFPFITGDRDFTKWVYRALTFLVISCPCALVISIPLVFFGTIGNGAKKGILYKDNSKIETISKLKSVAFDKTGTLTKGKPYVSGIEVFRDINENELLSLASSVEYGSSHPLAAAIVGFAESNGIPRDHAENVSETAGKGRSGKVAGKTVSVGSRKHVSELTGGVLTESGETAVYVTVDGELHGKISFADEIKNDSAETVGDLRAIGIKTYILSGDSYASANRIGRDVGVDVVKADLLPGDKLNALEEIMNNGKTAYVGDGINDAPALARADVGFAMGSMGADASVDASDVVISGDSPGKVLAAVRTSKKAMRIAYENIIFALAVKIAVMVLGVFGLASIWLAVFADVGVSIICIINSLRMNG